MHLPTASSRRIAILLALLSLLTTSCATRKPAFQLSPDDLRAQVADAMQRYQDAARSTDPDRISAFYTDTGVLLEPGIQPIVGRDAIRAFIASFPGVRVDVATATPERIDVWTNDSHNHAILWGSFHEKLGFPSQPDSEQHGRFVTQWIRRADGSWLIERFYRIPIATTETP